MVLLRKLCKMCFIDKIGRLATMLVTNAFTFIRAVLLVIFLTVFFSTIAMEYYIHGEH